MLKAIVTIKDENDRILQENKLIYETNAIPVYLGVRHDFDFSVVTADEGKLREAWKNHLYGEEEKNEQG